MGLLANPEITNFLRIKFSQEEILEEIKPRKTSRVKPILTVPQTDTGGRGEYPQVYE